MYGNLIYMYILLNYHHIYKPYARHLVDLCHQSISPIEKLRANATR